MLTGGGRKGIRIVSALAGLLLAFVLAPQAHALISDPDYKGLLLDPALQPKWVNSIPNALMPAFTFTPYAAGTEPAEFPAGVCGVTEDCYTISIRQIDQALGLVSESTGTPLLTKVWGYGSTSNAPSVGPFTGGVWYAPGPTVRATQGRPVRVTWLNELPNVAPPGLDPTYDCGPNAPDCYPYNRIVTHLHGGHIEDDSDGNPLAWFTPGFAVTGPLYKKSPYGPEGTYRYRMDQEAATTWYHDHAMGTTHNNVHMGLAGFFPITDDNEQALISGGILPGDPYEIGFALQDRTFRPDGSIAMPDQPVRDLLGESCEIDPVLGEAIPATCPIVPFSKAPDGHFIPFDPTITDASLRGPFEAPNGSLEYFGNMPLVNGVVYGKFDVEPRFYRMRLIGGTDSRTWVLKLVSRTSGSVIPVWQVASEQGMLANPVERDAFDLLPGERLDLLVDFRGLSAGEKIVMQNIGPDTPYAGPGDLSSDFPNSVIPEVMEFDVIALNNAIPDITPPTVLTDLRPLNGSIVPLAPTLPVRNVSLMEITDGLGRILPTIDSRGYMEAGVPFTELISLGEVEEWNIINTTMDAHPIHLHLVAFQVIGRQQFDPLSFVPPVTDTVSNIFTQPTFSYAAASVLEPPEPWEAGWKDTIDAPPGYVTRVKALFDIPGQYVWHCHILSHEEHDMMRSTLVTIPATSVVISAPVTSQPVGSGPVTFTAQASGLVDAALKSSNAFEYRFSVTPPGGTKTVMRDWGMAPADPMALFPHWTWVPPVIAGTYTITVDARQAGSSNAAGEVSNAMTFDLTANAAYATKLGVYAGTSWYLDTNGDGTWNGSPIDGLFSFGSWVGGGIPAAGEWAGTGSTKLGMFVPSDGIWLLDLNGDGVLNSSPIDGFSIFGAGVSSAVPVVGDWAGTGKASVGVFSNGQWYLDLDGNGQWDGTPTDGLYSFGMGIAGAVPVTGDWNGTGTSKLGIYADGNWYLDLNGNGIWDGTPTDGLYTFGTGLAGAQPVTGDWTGSGVTKIGVFADGVWYLDTNGNGVWDGAPTDTMASFGLGLTGAKAVTGKW